jgi:peptidoglycan/xylan/chitin deacetylase (PgdA/CDA1 family)
VGPLVRQLHRWFNRGGGPAILMYHRIAAPPVDPWGLSVSPERFAEQVQALCAHRVTLSMDAFVDRLQMGELPYNAVALTFDDGYRDNLCQAKPILEAAGVPATVFITTGRIGMDEEFWWDELARLVLTRAEPLSAHVRVESDGLQIDLPPIDPNIEPRVTWRNWNQPVTAREATYQRLWQALQNCAPERRESVMTQLREVCGATRPNPDDLPMSAIEVRTLVSDRVSVGAHGCSHQPLTRMPATARLEEIRRSRLEAGALSALPVTGFAYPHGDRDAETIDMVRRTGYRWACSTREATINPVRLNLHDLPRFAVRNWSASTLLSKLRTINA